MIKQLTLKNFRRHEDLIVGFTQGLNVIRGPNEIGKTTVAEGMLYALYGAKALRNSLAEVVTWGKKEGELRAELEIVVSGITYTFTRSKAGAECNYGEIKVVGQSEVSGFAAELLGADATVASLLMMASQSGLRGALDEGPAAVSGLMGKLADFDLIDRIVENAQADLSLGSDVALKAKLVQAEADVAQLRTEMPDAKVIEQLAGEIEVKAAQLSTVKATLAETIEPALNGARDAYHSALDEAERVVHLNDKATDLAGKIEAAGTAVARSLETAAQRPSDDEMAALREAARLEADHASVLAAHTKFTKLPAYPEVFWDQDKVSFDVEVQRTVEAVDALRQKRDAAQGEVTALAAQIKVVNATRITSSTCPTCGQATANDEHVATHNAGVEAKVAALTAETLLAQGTVDTYAAELTAAQADLRALRDLDTEAQARAGKVLAIPAQYLDFDPSHYPPKVTWKGPVPAATASVEAKQRLQAAEAQVSSATMAKGQAEAYRQQQDAWTAERLEVLTERDSVKAPAIEPLQGEFHRLSTLANESIELATDLEDWLTRARQGKAEAETALANAQQRLDTAVARVNEYTEDLKALAFNNNLVKKLRGLKPAITDHLWNTVLAAVSTFFTMLRGEQSVVTKDAKGFKVNDKAVESLSGSTIDCLALAIRVALTKTFIPHASFMTLDEPAHGCDNDRTGNVLGFLAGCGFDQIILASHDELSESVADNLIQLGE